MARPILDADTVLVVDGKIAAVGRETDIDCEVAGFATGNTAGIRNLDGGLIEVGRAGTFVLMDRAQQSPGEDCAGEY